MRVGFLSPHDPMDPSGFSGTPHSVWNALTDAGVDLVDLSVPGPEVLEATPGPLEPARRVWRRVQRLQRAASEKFASPESEYARLIAKADARSTRAQALIESANGLDLLFGVCASTPLYGLRTDLPIVYASDTTARLLNSSYPEYRKQSAEYRKACDEIERGALHKCRCFAATSKKTAQSAVSDYGVPPERVRVVEFGAHVVPDGMPIYPAPPTRESLELVLVAADPRRKRLALCVEVTKELRARGWNAILNFVGAHDPLVDDDAVRWAGRLALDDPADREAHKKILRRSHWMLLPSVAEAFGIAPCEAAHFGRPSVVTDVGGLPTVVQHGHTGMVVPVDAEAAVYADAIEEISEDSSRYGQMSGEALERAMTALSWPVWAKRMRVIFEEALEHAGDVHS